MPVLKPFRLATSSALALAVALVACKPSHDRDVDTTQITGAILISNEGPHTSPPPRAPGDGVASVPTNPTVAPAMPLQATPVEQPPGGAGDVRSQSGSASDRLPANVSDVGSVFAVPAPTAPDRPAATTIVTTTSTRTQPAPAPTFFESSFGPPPPAQSLDESSFGPDAGF